MRKRNVTITVRCTVDESLMEKNKPLLQEAAQPVTFAQITEQNWLALIGLLQNLSESQDRVIKTLSKSITAAQMQKVLDQLSEIAVQSQNACQEIQNQITATTSSATTELLSQAGKMSEEYSSRLKEQDAWRKKLNKRIIRIVVASQSALLILSTALQIWLR